MKETEVVTGQPVEAREAAMVVFKLAATLGEVTLFAQLPVVLRLLCAGRLGQDNRFCTQFGDGVADVLDVLGVISFVSHRSTCHSACRCCSKY